MIDEITLDDQKVQLRERLAKVELTFKILLSISSLCFSTNMNRLLQLIVDQPMCTKLSKPALYEDEWWLKSRDDTLTTSASTANFNAAQKLKIEAILNEI